MEYDPLVLETRLPYPPGMIWYALTDRQAMAAWYFNIAEFRAERGVVFRFYAGPGEMQYLHVCRILELIPERMIAYSWRYEGIPGESTVAFELFEMDSATLLRLTHSGLLSFPKTHSDLSPAAFEAGWKQLIGEHLRSFLRSRDPGGRG